jgi:hypothetical protein
VTLGLLLVIRHRAFRLTMLLVLAITVIAAVGVRDRGASNVPSTVLVAGGSLIAVAASRVLAPGPALAGARWVAAPGWLVPTGRLAGALIVVVPATVATVMAMSVPASHAVDLVRVTMVATLYVSALGALTVMLTPIVGSSGAATCGFVAAWLGGVPPSAIVSALATWSYGQRPVVWLWNSLPLMWRAERWLTEGQIADGVVLAAWIVLGVTGAAWAVAASARWTHARREPTA